MLTTRLKLGIGSPQRSLILLEPTAVKQIQDPVEIEIAIGHVLPEALTSFSISKLKLGLSQVSGCIEMSLLHLPRG